MDFLLVIFLTQYRNLLISVIPDNVLFFLLWLQYILPGVLKNSQQSRTNACSICRNMICVLAKKQGPESGHSPFSAPFVLVLLSVQAA